ncbi:hypothetical protein CAP35_13045 [Chitinophagaceae bacterium IBVUCB1]|nr:hypothetical protein CAP35_13045 [Chitinophagaceae bacterium IBVUCB1]
MVEIGGMNGIEGIKEIEEIVGMIEIIWIKKSLLPLGEACQAASMGWEGFFPCRQELSPDGILH